MEERRLLLAIALSLLVLTGYQLLFPPPPPPDPPVAPAAGEATAFGRVSDPGRVSLRVYLVRVADIAGCQEVSLPFELKFGSRNRSFRSPLATSRADYRCPSGEIEDAQRQPPRR